MHAESNDAWKLAAAQADTKFYGKYHEREVGARAAQHATLAEVSYGPWHEGAFTAAAARC